MMSIAGVEITSGAFNSPKSLNAWLDLYFNHTGTIITHTMGD
jgi:hypothetical protein